MFEVTVETGFSAAHRLRDYEGECERLHGHNYKVAVTVAAGELGPSGMLVDFKELKAALGEVVGTLDHRCLNDDIPDFAEGALNPTAENIARWICERLTGELPRDALPGPPGRGKLAPRRRSRRVARVRVWESDTSAATYAPPAARVREE